MAAADTIPLPELSRELAALTGKTPPSYRALYLLVVDNRLPATRERSGWAVKRADLAAIAETLRLTEPAPGKRPRRAAAASMPAAA